MFGEYKRRWKIFYYRFNRLYRVYQISKRWGSFPPSCTNIISGTGLNASTWMRLVVEFRDAENNKNGRLFFQGLSPTVLSRFGPYNYHMHFQVQASSECILNQVDIVKVCEIMRLGRQGATTHTRNMKAGKDVTKAVRNWRRSFHSVGFDIFSMYIFRYIDTYIIILLTECFLTRVKLFVYIM